MARDAAVAELFGAAVAAAKLLRFSEDQVNSTIALCASLAAGLTSEQGTV